MKTKLAFLSLTLLVLGLFNSCKDDETEEPQPSPKEILTDGIWNFVKFEEYDNNGNLQDQDVISGETFEFTTSGHFYYYDVGGLEEYGTFELNTDSDPMVITLTISSGSQFTFDILQLEENTMKWKNNFSGGYDIYYFTR